MSEANLSIGQVASAAGVNASTIRYYERIGLLAAPERVRGQRRFTEETVRILGVIAVAQRAGFSLDEARALVSCSEDGRPAGRELQRLARRKLPEVEALIRRAETMRRWLTTASGCGCESLDACALFAEEPPSALRLEHVESAEGRA